MSLRVLCVRASPCASVRVPARACVNACVGLHARVRALPFKLREQLRERRAAARAALRKQRLALVEEAAERSKCSESVGRQRKAQRNDAPLDSSD